VVASRTKVVLAPDCSRAFGVRREKSISVSLCDLCASVVNVF
jgi:hypothetical protein